jgi:hypothetical protein
MSKQTEPKPKITHIMADGTVRDSVEGVVIPVTEETKPFYQLLAAMVKEKDKSVKALA